MRKHVLAAAAAGVASLTLALGHSPATAASFSSSVLVATGTSSEPGIDVAPDGTVYINAPRGLPSLSSLWRSDNGGTSFTTTSNLTRAASIGGGDSDLSIAPDTGRLSWTDLTLASAGVATSTDRGNTWLAQPFSTPIQDRQWVASSRGGVTYHATHELAAGIVVAKSVDGGFTYPVQTVAAPTTNMGCLCPTGSLVVEPGTGTLGSTDKIAVSWSDGAGVRVATSVNGGLTWGLKNAVLSGIGETMNSFPVLAAGGNGRLVAVWQEQSNTTTRIGFTSSTNFGGTWAAPRYLVTTGTSVFPWIDIKGDKVAIVLYHTSSSGTPNTVATSSQWFVKHLESADFGATWSGLSIADPTPVKTGRICTDGLACGGNRELGDFFQVAFDNNQKANIAYIRVSGGGTQVRFVKEL